MHRNSQKLHIFTKIFFAFLFLIVVTVSVLLFRNSLQIHNFIEWRTSVYLTDVTYQIVDKVMAGLSSLWRRSECCGTVRFFLNRPRWSRSWSGKRPLPVMMTCACFHA
jgi:hypothetical protein